MKKLALVMLATVALTGCKALITPAKKGDITKIPGRETATFMKLAPDPASAAFAVPGLGVTIRISVTEADITIAWNTNGVFVVDAGPTPSGPWTAVGKFQTPAVFPNLVSNSFYRIYQSPVKLERYWLGDPIWFTLCGNNDVVTALQDAHWSSAHDYLWTLTNGVLTAFPLHTPGMPPCAPFASAIDVASARYFTLEGNCYYGVSTGPYVVREWQLVGKGGLWTNAHQLNSFSDGEFGNSWGDLLRLQSGALVWCWKSDQGYCWRYRSPAGVWQQKLCRSDIPMGPTIMVMGQHPDGTVYTAITRDTYHTFALVALREQGGQMNFSSLRYIPCEGEFPDPSIVPDYRDDRLIVNRNVDPYFAWQWGEAWQTIKGSDMQSAFVYSENAILQSTHLPAGNVATANAQNMNEPVNAHGATFANGKLWLFRQEFQPREWRFNAVYATPWEGDHWGDRIFLYRAPDCDNCRGLALNSLRSFRNTDTDPKRIIFSNVNEDGETEIFELVP